jgi:hypothetical protein
MDYKKKKRKMTDDMGFKAYPKESGFDFVIGMKQDRKKKNMKKMKY